MKKKYCRVYGWVASDYFECEEGCIFIGQCDGKEPSGK